jgi:short-subunit dehydrogenase
MNMAKLKNKTVVITGASSGLGASLALECAKQGARLALFARDGERLRAVAERCETEGAEALAVVGDVTVAADGKRLVAETVGRFGCLDFLIANAGVSMWTRFDEAENLGLFRKLMEVNYLGAVHCVHPALPHLKQSGGVFVAISSIQGKVGVPLHTGYSAAKHALQGFCDALRMEVDADGVGVTTVLLHWLRGTELRNNAFGGDGQAVGASSRKHSKESVTLEEASTAIMRGMLKRERQLYVPKKLKYLAVANALWPGLAERVVKGKVGRENK